MQPLASLPSTFLTSPALPSLPSSQLQQGGARVLLAGFNAHDASTLARVTTKAYRTRGAWLAGCWRVNNLAGTLAACYIMLPCRHALRITVGLTRLPVHVYLPRLTG